LGLKGGKTEFEYICMLEQVMDSNKGRVRSLYFACTKAHSLTIIAVQTEHFGSYTYFVSLSSCILPILCLDFNHSCMRRE